MKMLEAINITKRFGGVTALDGVSLTLHPGAVTAILGENGAGKSTLMKILSGVHTDYEGEVRMDGKAITLGHPRAAEAAGIAIIHQELNLVPELDIAANIFLGREPRNRWGLLDRSAMRTRCLELLNRLGLEADPDRMVGTLKVGEQQLVEIAKALHLEASVIIMDEPTSALSDRETERLFRIIRGLRDEGRTLVYISHRFDELFALADRYIVLRDGRSVGAGMMPETHEEELILMMTGRDMVSHRLVSHSSSGVPMLQVAGLHLKSEDTGRPNVLHDISFTLHAGEVIGLYGLMGAGRSELLGSLFGMYSDRVCMTVSIDDKNINISDPAGAVALGIALVPEDRKRQGIFPGEDIRSNLSVAVLERISRLLGLVDILREAELSLEMMNRLSVRASSDRQRISTLSGGNQQKVILGRWLATKPRILLLDEPTRGIDVGAKAEIHALIRDLAADGMAVLVASSELPEILSLSDRVLVLCEGRLTADLSIAEANEASVLRYAFPQKQST
jgi:ribose transport system ATP-binding protein